MVPTKLFLNFDAGRTTNAVLDVEPAKREWRVRDLCASRRLVRIGASERSARDRDFVSEGRSEWCSNHIFETRRRYQIHTAAQQQRAVRSVWWTSFALIHRHSIGARRSIMLKPAPQSLRELPRAPPGSLPPPPGGFGLPPPPGFPGFRPGFPPMMPGMMRPPIMHGMRPAPNASVHQTGLTPSLLRLFVARPPVEYHPPPAKPKKTQPYTGIADYVKLFTCLLYTSPSPRD